ncbi:hypothetical protein C4K88_16530 [Arthrobacter pityocampae]|uniref:Uncharacterized protein n=1 Tax=Arthrobacter pityocampae TaxID=547334 RepID=A0A2S5IU18_9MICC|nr:hypothetical protein C4K88_16530 [Arthrobacter pityocampae]
MPRPTAASGASGGLTLSRTPPRPATSSSAPAAPSVGLNLSRPGTPASSSPSAPSAPSAGLNLGRTPAPSPSAPPPPSVGLDLSRPPAPSASSSAPSVGLNLARPGTSTPSTPVGPAAGLALHRTSPVETPARPTDISSALFAAPSLGDLRELSEEQPVIRLDPRQSAIGTLAVTGVEAIAWEDVERVTGAANRHGAHIGVPVMTSGNRPLVGFHEQNAVVALRHLRKLRRAIFIAGQVPLTVRVFDGKTVAVVPANRRGDKAVLYLSRIGAVLELRVEYVAAQAPDEAIWAEFGFTMSIPHS